MTATAMCSTFRLPATNAESLLHIKAQRLSPSNQARHSTNLNGSTFAPRSKRLFINGPQKVGREFSFNTFRVGGWWRGERSGVQILPPPEGAPRAPVEIADHPFILEFPIAS